MFFFGLWMPLVSFLGEFGEIPWPETEGGFSLGLSFLFLPGFWRQSDGFAVCWFSKHTNSSKNSLGVLYRYMRNTLMALNKAFWPGRR